ncbi:MAG TPA: transcription-repair coupling factor [Alkalispirochaeta sp.]|nr:transcription-repair coupling factor [Alkalispirochaeta sp.]
MQRDSGRPLLVIVPNESEAAPLRGDLELFGTPSTILPSWGTGAYATPSENAPVWGERVRALTELWRASGSVVVAPLRAVSLLMPPSRHSMQYLTSVEKGQSADPHELGRFLSEMGYWRVPRVSVHGEFAVRGEVVDVFLPGWDAAVRIVFDFDRVSEIREFDPSNQSSLRKRASVQIYPLREVLWDADTQAHLREIAQSAPEIRHKREEFTEELVSSNAGPYWAAAALSDNHTILDYLDDSVGIVWVDRQRILAGFEAYRKEFETVFAQEHFRRPLPRPDRVLVDIDHLIGQAENRSVVFESLADADDTAALRFSCDPSRSFFGNVSYLKEELSSLVTTGNKVIVLADTEAQEKRIGFLLRELDVTVAVGHVSGGFALPEQRLVLVQENEIFGRRKRAPASLKKVESSPIDTFVELDEGDFVVHVNYGIGVFRGIKRLKAAGNERDYIELEYADQEVVFTPIEQVNLIQRYIGSGGQNPRLDRIGGKSWEKRKSSVKKNVEDLADRLISLYSRRKQVQGFAFPEDTEWQLEFESGFPYEETEDQLRCIAEIKQDMERPQPMDRLICGDVGYGKTELALRAAFKAVMSGKQVAILAPTTILVEQHYENMVERFERFPIRIGMLSRFVARKEQKRVLSELATGDLDIVIGTHRVLQKDVVFSDVGLLVIDEEQRFGVKAKERLKELKTNVDTLTLTATPIPRTLHMSLLEIRDMSLLTTPPHNRHPIRTVISEFNEEEIGTAIRREVERGGQVFFLHNRVETLENVSQFVQNLVPEIIVEFAHGKMGSTELEDIMHRFIHGAFQVLVATTIIENGIDIPNVNTIIIDRADMYGISQLYQLRGRVGRSDKVAYAYLFYPEERALSELAMKRLQIISDFTELGSGFKIALKDLEVRGAGNLLGSQQSGDILSVGFDLYLKLLDEAIRNRGDDETQFTEDEVYLELEYTGFIPDFYIEEPMEKMEVYKKIAGVSTESQLESLIAEIGDRFGPMPDEVQSLLSLAEIRILARRLHIASMKERRGQLHVEFGKVASVSVERVLALIQNSGGNVRLDPHQANVLIMETGKVGLKEKSEFIRGRLAQLL